MAASTSTAASPILSVSANTPTVASTNTSYSFHYDIIVNSGSDVKNNFASHLNRSLLDHGFKVLFDQQETQAGDNLKSQIEEAIATSSIHIAIFSPRFAKSKWCLNELLLMLKSKATVIPVFYHVKPSDLLIRTGKDGVYAQVSRILGRTAKTGVYAKALQNHKRKKRCDSQTLVKWTTALFDVAQLGGLELEEYKGDEGDLVDGVVQRAEEEVTRQHFFVAKSPMPGLDEKLQDFEKTVLLQQQQHNGGAKFVGIVGSGGVGKTTLAIEFFNRNRSAYYRSCFLSDVREVAGRNSLHSLQNKLVKDLTILDPDTESTHGGIMSEFSSYLCSSRALIILDDVEHVEQMDALYSPVKDILYSGSLILVTARDKDVLVMSGMGESSIYTMTGLNSEHSQELFCLHAFHKRLPVHGFETAVTKFLDVCNGLPLSLKVLGALVYQKDLNYWKAPLRKISQIRPTDLQRILKTSYDGLDDQEKELFLDIACFLIKEDSDMVRSIWDASGWVGCLNLQNLVNKCLVEIDGNNCIRMHDHLRDLGRDLEEKDPPRFHRRLWHPIDNHFHNEFEKSTVRGINMVQGRLVSSLDSPVELSNSFIDMSRLQLLRAEGDCLKSISNLLKHSDLLWLRWNGCPYTCLPSWIPIRNLRVLQVVGGELETLWEGESEAPLELKELNIDAAPLQLPKSIGLLKHLEKIELKCALKTLPEEFFHLSSVKHLRMSTSMELLPNTFGNLTNLQHLSLTGCQDLQMLPDSFGTHTSLQDLDLSDCSNLSSLPGSFGRLINVQDLDLSGSSRLHMLPDSFGYLTNLQYLDLSGCSNLSMLPGSFGNLRNLQDLDLSGSSKLRRLPDSFGNLISIQHLNLTVCHDLQMLPDSFGNLANLHDLDLSACSSLSRLPDSFANLTNLRHLSLNICKDLEGLPDSFGNLANLEYLDVSGLSSLRRLLDSFGDLTNLRHLNLFLCNNLKELPHTFGNLRNLQHLNLNGCSNLETLPISFGNLTNLQHLDLSGCSKLYWLPDLFENLTNLQHVNLNSCISLETLPASLKNLTILRDFDWPVQFHQTRSEGIHVGEENVHFQHPEGTSSESGNAASSDSVIPRLRRQSLYRFLARRDSGRLRRFHLGRRNRLSQSGQSYTQDRVQHKSKNVVSVRPSQPSPYAGGLLGRRNRASQSGQSYTQDRVQHKSKNVVSVRPSRPSPYAGGLMSYIAEPYNA